jgi:hypothetical protein
MRPAAPFVCALAACALTACSSITPIAVTGPKNLRYEGRAWTTAYTGSFSAGGCSGTYTGPLGGEDLVIAMQCADGKHGMGTGRQSGGSFAGGTVLMSDGTRMSIAPIASDLSYSVVPGGAKNFTTGWQLPARDRVLPGFLR